MKERGKVRGEEGKKGIKTKKTKEKEE